MDEAECNAMRRELYDLMVVNPARAIVDRLDLSEAGCKLLHSLGLDFDEALDNVAENIYEAIKGKLTPAFEKRARELGI